MHGLFLFRIKILYYNRIIKGGRRYDYDNVIYYSGIDPGDFVGGHCPYDRIKRSYI